MQGIDLVNDNPENALLREVDQIRESQKIMKKTLETVNHQIATNLNTRHKLKRDFENKDIAMNLDQEAFAVSKAKMASNEHCFYRISSSLKTNND